MAVGLLLHVSAGQAQSGASPFQFTHINEKDGLSYNIINCFLKDSDGFLWIGTYDGLNRFDGSHFTVFKSNRASTSSLLHNTVHNMCEDREGNIWCATDAGICRYNKKLGRFQPFDSSENVVRSPVENVICDKDGDIWFESDRGLAQYIFKQKKTVYYSNDSSDHSTPSSDYIHKNGIVEDPSGKGLWLATTEGLNYFDKTTKKAFHAGNNPDSLPIFNTHSIYPIAVNHRGQLLYGDNTLQRVIVYTIASKKLEKQIELTSKVGRKYFPVSTIFADNEDNTWISTWNYTMQFIDGKTGKATEVFHNESEKNSIASEFFWNAWQDKNGAIWFGTVNGISIYNPLQSFYRVHRFDNLYPSLKDTKGVASVYEDNDGSWWIGTYNRGLVHYFPKLDSLLVYNIPASITNIKEGIAQQIALSVIRVDENIWMASGNGVLVFNTSTKTFSRLDMPASPAKYFISKLLLQNDSTAWVGTHFAGLFMYNTRQKEWRHFTSKNDSVMAHSKNNVIDIKTDRSGTVWLSTFPSGLAYYSPGRQKFIPADFNKDGENASKLLMVTIAFDKNNKLWTTSKGTGIAMYDPATKESFLWRESDGLVFDHCMAALPDQQGQVWVAAYNKFSVYNIAKNTFRNFTLPFNESNYDYTNFMFPLRNGHLLATMRGTVVEFMPERVVQNNGQGKPLINSIVLPDTVRLLKPGDETIRLGVDENYFSIYYSMLTAAQFRYQYRLEGFDDKWIDAGERTIANYTNVPGGDYIFQVKAISGNTDTSVTEVRIHIKTVFYKTWWFRLLIILLLAAMVYSVYRYRMLQTRKMHLLQLRATRLEKDKTEIQYQNLMNQFNPHFLFNSLTSLNSLIYADQDLASQFLEHLSRVYRYLLTNKETQLVTLEKEIEFVKSYIALLKIRFEDGLLIDIDVPQELLKRKIVPVTFQIMIENAIKHNIIDRDTPLHIQFKADEKYLHITNNIQRKAFVETSNKRGLASLQTLYKFLSSLPLIIEEKENTFFLKVPLL
jgi:ligand-binding sensor domain-containing protein